MKDGKPAAILFKYEEEEYLISVLQHAVVKNWRVKNATVISIEGVCVFC